MEGDFGRHYIETYFDTVNKDKILHDTASDFLFYFFPGNQIAN